ncbi:MAG: hypothetical protein ABSG65_13720 [Bryobacteraceae bacterium]|jgi:hypothetical protein
MKNIYAKRCCLYLMTASAILNAQSYSVLVLNPTPDFKGYGASTNVFSINDLGQVLGEEIEAGGIVRAPVVWTKGVATKLTIPAGYSYPGLGAWLITNSSQVMGGLTDNSSGASTLALWDGRGPDPWTVATILQGAPSGCADGALAMETTGFGMNKAGHIAGTSANPAEQCSAAWFYDGAQFSILPPPTFEAGCGGNLQVSSINDADEIGGTFDPESAGCTPGSPDYPFIYSPGSGLYTQLASPAGIQGWAVTGINNRQEALGSYGPPYNIAFWNSAGAQNVAGLDASLNDIGQVALYAGNQGGPYQSEIWRNGTATPVNLPVEVAGGAYQFIDNAGQLGSAYGMSGLTGSNAGLGALLTPRRACASDVTSQVGIAAGGFHLNSGTGRYVQQITLTNNGATTIASPVSLVFDGLPATATLYAIAGSTLCGTRGSPYVDSSASLAPGASEVLDVQFIDTSGLPISYSNRIIAGTGGR